MKSKYFSAAIGVAAGLALGITVDGLRASSSGASDGNAKAKDAPSTVEVDPRVVKLGTELARRANLEIATVEKQALKPTLRLVGSVNFDADEVADVGARIAGRVSRMFVTAGDEVRRGDPLVEIESNELGSALAALQSARANLIAAEILERRETDLAKQQLSSATVVERARAEAKALRAELNGASQRLMAMGFSPDDIEKIEAGHGPRLITLRAPIAGEVVDRYAMLGQVVSPTEPVLRIADLDHLWVELDVFERDLAHVADGNTAEIESETHPGKTFRGHVTHIDATVDTTTRTSHVRVEVDNPERLLRPGQFVHARLATEGDARPVIGVPRTAVLQVEGEPSVFVVAEGENSYMARPVELGIAAGDWVEITRGLVEGDRVVTEGAFVLKSELLR
ncbi:MAG: putative Co/Zn/Cd efflux system rane fusion protein [Myxococcaceae bacterium]|nr:putative Co/Zn/Cd efflux system rane fusion protein [Myxococcaceae bacterium]